MPYVIRDPQGHIIQIETNPTENTELIDPNSPELWAFLFKNHPDRVPQHFLNTSDTEMIRVVEDLVTVLLNKNLILLTDLPVAVQNKINSRKLARDSLNENVRLLVQEDDIL